MASSPCNCCTQVPDSLSLSSSSPPPPPPPPSSIEHVWNHIKLSSLSNINKHSSTIFHKHNHHPFLSPSNTSFHASHSHTTKTSQQHIYDPRHKRIIRNRESAVRSRARKQAYEYGLKIKIARLTEENSRLRRQLEELQLCLSSSSKRPGVGRLYRTSPCPF